MEVDNSSLTDLESAIYDRQLRVWGAHVQKKLGKAKILVIGITGVVAETCKNVVLAGVGDVSLLDKRPVNLENASANLLVSSDDLQRSTQTLDAVCALSLRDFNPMVNISVVQGNWENQKNDFLQNFDAVILGKSSLSLQKEINLKCREGKKKICFFYVDCCGYFAKIFFDLNHHFYTLKGKEKCNPELIIFPPLQDVLNFPVTNYAQTHPLLAAFSAIQTFEEHENKKQNVAKILIAEKEKLVFEYCEQMNLSEKEFPAFSKHVGQIMQFGTEELSPTCAIMGGILAQEVIRSISGQGKPMCNFFVFDAFAGVGGQAKIC